MAKPKAPENIFCSIDETLEFAVVKWDQVTEDTDDTATTVLSYKVYRATKSNLNDMQLVASVTTLDINSKIDTIYVDKDVDLIFNNYYKVTATNADGESDASDIAFDLLKLDLQIR